MSCVLSEIILFDIFLMYLSPRLREKKQTKKNTPNCANLTDATLTAAILSTPVVVVSSCGCRGYLRSDHFIKAADCTIATHTQTMKNQDFECRSFTDFLALFKRPFLPFLSVLLFSFFLLRKKKKKKFLIQVWKSQVCCEYTPSYSLEHTHRHTRTHMHTLVR